MMNNNIVKIAFVGDILLHSNYNKFALEKEPSSVFEKICNVLSDADLRFGNLESVLSKKGDPIYGKGCLVGDEKYISALKKVGFDVLSLANNHSFDFGIEAYEDMSLNLQKVGIDTVGTGRNLEESRKMIVVSVNNFLLGFIAYSSKTNNGRNYASDVSPGVAPLEEEYIVEDIKKYKKDVDYLIVSLHWGIEHSPDPTPDQISLAHTIIDAGAKIVVGNHPQILQGIERYNGGLVMYSLGNFCHSDYYWEGPQRTYQFKLKAADKESIMVKVELSKSKIECIDIIPLWINDRGQPEICEGGRSNAILQKLSERSKIITRPDFEKHWENMLIKKRIGNPIRIWWEAGNLFHKIKNFKFSQIKTLLNLFIMFIQTRFSKSPSKWHIFNPRNDKKPRPFCGENEDHD